jgi:hypothetical protein
MLKFYLAGTARPLISVTLDLKTEFFFQIVPQQVDFHKYFLILDV